MGGDVVDLPHTPPRSLVPGGNCPIPSQTVRKPEIPTRSSGSPLRRTDQTPTLDYSSSLSTPDSLNRSLSTRLSVYDTDSQPSVTANGLSPSSPSQAAREPAPVRPLDSTEIPGNPLISVRPSNGGPLLVHQSDWFKSCRLPRLTRDTLTTQPPTAHRLVSTGRLPSVSTPTTVLQLDWSSLPTVLPVPSGRSVPR